jgi:recombination protein RecR
MNKFINSLVNVYQNSKICNICHNIDVSSPCSICLDYKRDEKIICVVSDIADLWSIERAEFFKGKYHVLGGKLSAVLGIKPEDLDITGLYNRIKNENIEEVIIAMSADLDGQTTMFFINEKIKDLKVKITTLSCGVPIGGELENLDDGTIIAAFSQRRGI